MRRVITVLPILLLASANLFSPANADSNETSNSGVIYNSVITPLPGNLASQPFEAQQVSEFGNAVIFSSAKTQELTKVVVTMSSWGCQAGSWSTNTCVTAEGSSFTLPITLNIYSPSVDGTNPGKQLTSITKKFEIKFRPSASPLCTGGNAGKWYNNSSKTCFNGFAQNITFEVKNTKVTGSAIFGIAYNTSHYGYAPIGDMTACFKTSAGCGYDSLNVALSEDPTNVTAGKSADPGKLWIATAFPDFYADSGAAGLGTFRLDSPKAAAWWGVNAPYSSAPWYVPSIKVFGNQSSKDEKKEEKKSEDTSSESKSHEKPAIKTN
jgi:hypothetical protein